MKQRQLFLRDILAILFKRKLLIISFVILVFAVTFVGNYVWPPTYESTAQLRLMRGREVYQTDPTVMKSTENIAMVQMTVEDVNSEIESITSKDVLERVAKDMGLDKKLPGRQGVFPLIYRMARRVTLEAEYALSLKARPTPLQAAVRTLRKAIEVEPLRDSYLIEVRCQLRDPSTAQDVLLHLLDVYLKHRLAIFSNTKNSPFFDQQVERVQRSLETAQANLEKFRQENKIVSLDAEKELLLQQYTDLKKLMVQMQESEAAAQNLGKASADSALIQTLSRQTGSPVVTEMQMRLLELLSERNRLSQSLGPKHPNIIAINKEVGEALTGLKEAIATTKATAQTKMGDLEQRLNQLNEVMARLDNLEREVKVQSSSLEYYSKKLEESRVTDAMTEAQISNVRVISSPAMPVDPVRPRKLFNLVFALIAGIVGGLALAFFLEFLDHGIKTPEDVECYLGVPVLASYFRSRKSQLDIKETERLCTVLEVVNAGSPVRMMQVASSAGGEGAHAVARSLAEAYANDAGTQTLFVDFVGTGEGRKPLAAGRPGLSDVLLEQAALDDVVTPEGDLFVLSRGSQGEIPIYVWNSPRMQALLEQLRKRFDYVIFHLGPVFHSPDTLRLARLVDGVLVVVRADSTRREVVTRAIDMITEAKGKVLGAVLTERKQQIPTAIYRRI
jgi:uncharacterized protein involved in exopolysaccharide biosynthesis/Mrp family chromosome partitioning ATPase